MKVVITGNPINVRFLCSQLEGLDIDFTIVEHNFRSLGNKFKKVMLCDIVHIFSLKSNSKEGIIWIFILLFLKIIRKKVILHWLGTDVMEVGSFAGWYLPKLVTKHLAYSPWLVDELSGKGIESSWLPVLPPLNVESLPLPKNFTVLVFLKKRFAFYGGEYVSELIKLFPNALFHIVGDVNETNKIVAPNVKYFGMVEYDRMDEVYNNSTVLLRLTEHDGLSLMVLEALARGRYVIWSQEFPHCFKAVDASEAAGYLKELMDVEEVNIAGYNFINYKFDNIKWLDKLIEVYGEDLV